MEVLILFLGLFAWSEGEFIRTVAEQQKLGYRWEEIECRSPNDNLPNISIETPVGNKYVCYKLEK